MSRVAGLQALLAAMEEGYIPDKDHVAPDVGLDLGLLEDAFYTRDRQAVAKLESALAKRGWHGPSVHVFPATGKVVAEWRMDRLQRSGAPTRSEATEESVARAFAAVRAHHMEAEALAREDEALDREKDMPAPWVREPRE